MPRALIPDPDQPRGAHECSVCQKAFKNRSELARHENIHRKDKPFKYLVEGCGKSFSQKGQLTNHANTHTGARPVTCAFCLRGFAEGGSTGRHEREQHSNFAGFRCPVSGCKLKYINKRRRNWSMHLKQKHGVNEPSADPWHHAYTTDGVKIDPTRGLIEQPEWEPFLQDGRAGASLPNRARAKRRAAALWKERQTAPAARARSSRKRRAAEIEDDEDDEDEEYKPVTRARATKRMRRSAPKSGPEPETKPAAAPATDGALDGLFTISPASDGGSDAGVTSGSSSSLTSLVATPDHAAQGELQFTFDAYDYAPSEAGPSTPYGSHNALELSVPDHAPVYGAYQSPFMGNSPAEQYGEADNLGLFMGQQVPQGFNELDPAAFDTSLYDGAFPFDNDFLNAQTTQLEASYGDYCTVQPNATPSLHGGRRYQHHNLAPTQCTDLLSASSPLTASSQGTSRSPSPLGLVMADNGFSVPSISSLGRARANAQLMMPQVCQDIALLSGYTTSM